MCFVFTCGEHTFRKEVEGYEGITCQCHNCGNWSGKVVKTNPWFTFCFVVSPPRNSTCPPPPLSPLFPVGATKEKQKKERIQLTAFALPSPDLARPPSLHQRLPGRHMPHLQLRPAAREPARRHADARRRRRRPARNSDAESRRSTAGLGARATTRPAAHAIWITRGEEPVVRRAVG